LEEVSEWAVINHEAEFGMIKPVVENVEFEVGE
jgi:hypothetical protein